MANGNGLLGSTEQVVFGPEKEAQFQKWLSDWSEKTGVLYDPDVRGESGELLYDYRAAYDAGEEPVLIPGDEDTDWEGIPYRHHYHWSSEFKGSDHPTIDAGRANGNGRRGLLGSYEPPDFHNR